jgi:protein phosphatase 2C family protein 2/3
MDSGDESDATTTDAPAASESTPAKSRPISASHSQKGSPAAPSFTSIGSPQVATHSELQRGASAKATNDNKPQEQLRKTPEGDQASAAVQVEGLMDTSEGPLKM